jgi:hypothetical protein
MIPPVGPPIRLHMSMSLDGYIAGPDDTTGQGWGTVDSGCSTGFMRRRVRDERRFGNIRRRSP